MLLETLVYIEKLRQLIHVVGNLSHKGIARRALPLLGVKMRWRGNKKVNKVERYSCVWYEEGVVG